MYRAENSSTEPMKSVLENNPEIYFVEPKRGADWGNWEYKPGSYYDTTTGDKHEYWRDHDLPRPTKDIDRLRHDFVTWGYCMVEDALSPSQVATVQERVLAQAEGERRARIAQKTPSGQNVNCCVNKGECFEALIEQHPSIMQGGPLVGFAAQARTVCLTTPVCLGGGAADASRPQVCSSSRTAHRTRPALARAAAPKICRTRLRHGGEVDGRGAVGHRRRGRLRH